MESSSIAELAQKLASPAGKQKRQKPQGLFEAGTTGPALKQAFAMLRPDIQWKNPVMFVVEIGAFLTLLSVIQAALGHSDSMVPVTYFVGLDVWLWLTVLFANFATALAESRGKAHAESPKRSRRETVARRLSPAGTVDEVVSTELDPGDLVVVKAGEVIPGDGEIIKGIASVDESAITGESAPVIREAGGDRSGVTGGTTVRSDQIVVRITAGAGESSLDRMIALVEGASRQRTPNEIALTLVLTAFTLIFLIVVVPLWPMAWNAEQYMMSYLGLQQPLHSLGTDFPTLVALLVCLIPTTIGALLAAIGIAGMNRALQANIIAKSGKAVETAGDIDIVLLDKTGTITEGNRRATQFLPVEGYSATQVRELAAQASAADETPEGKSIVSIYESQSESPVSVPQDAEFIAFSASTRMSGINLSDGRRIRKGAADAVANFVREQGGTVPMDVSPLVDGVASRGATPLVVADGPKVVGVVVLEDILKPSMKERFDRLRKMGLRTVMITGDNPLTAAAIAKQAGVDDFLAQATPENKLEYSLS
jgi:K+-transporting ATPase ATPase B chain